MGDYWEIVARPLPAGVTEVDVERQRDARRAAAIRRADGQFNQVELGDLHALARSGAVPDWMLEAATRGATWACRHGRAEYAVRPGTLGRELRWGGGSWLVWPLLSDAPSAWW